MEAVVRITQNWAKPVERPGTDRKAWTAAAVWRGGTGCAQNNERA